MDKRLRKSITRSVEYLDNISSEFSQDKDNNNIFATIEPSWFVVNEVEATKGLVSMLEKRDSIGGFIVRRNGNDPTDFVELYRKIGDRLPQEKLRYTSGALNLSEIVELIRQGVDMFDSSICTELTEARKALILPSFFENTKITESLPKKTDANGSVDEDKDQLAIFKMGEKRW